MKRAFTHQWNNFIRNVLLRCELNYLQSNEPLIQRLMKSTTGKSSKVHQKNTKVPVLLTTSWLLSS